MDSIIQSLLRWSSDNGIRLHPSLRIRTNDSDAPRSLAVFSDAFIKLNDIVASIPKSAILSVKSCTLAHRIPSAPYGLGSQLALSLALSHEIAQAAASRWHGYLQSLPTSAVPIALLWGDHDAFGVDSDGEEATTWITGTEVERAVRSEESQNLLDEIRHYYHSVAKYLLPRRCTISHFLYAYSLVSSRAFMVDAYHGLSMVPIADAFNHVTENHVHLECDYDVCPLCGSLTECAHDREDTPSYSSEHMDWQSSCVSSVPDTCDMIANRPIPPSSEVFNTYGARRSNASLLAWYGFALDGNENDTVGWDFAEVVQALNSSNPSSVEPSQQSYKAVLHAWLSSIGSMVTDDSRLVYRPDLDDAEERSFAGPSTVLCINSDAQLSVYLWVYLAICAANCEIDNGSVEANLSQRTQSAVDVETLVALLGAVMDKQVLLEKTMSTEDGEDIDLDQGNHMTTEGRGLACRVAYRHHYSGARRDARQRS
ncbi:SET domain-containing protein [Daedalea quercina L-15889]|uniref:SET domain-containing protein n=1 Tax=Daedalea quercina L-15889 TaxID=1314783 RepID=A0A165NDD4_9APHY|nr:SET domain-containing protein [Daedalea quercina L-15889]